MLRHVVYVLYLVGNGSFHTLTNFTKQIFLLIVRVDINVKEPAMIKGKYQRNEPCGLTSPDLESDQ